MTAPRSDFAPHSVAFGLREDAFRHLSVRDRKRLLRLMARIAEKSYRRGAQHGVVEARDNPSLLPEDLSKWRYERSLDTSPGLNAGPTFSARERLMMECGELRWLGFNDDGDGP